MANKITNIFGIAMTYSVIKTYAYVILLLANIFLSMSVKAEIENPVSDVSTKNTKTDKIEMDISDSWLAEECLENILLECDKEKRFFSFLDKTQESISSRMEKYVRSIDKFFSDDNVYHGTSGSYLRIRADAIWNEGDGIGYDTNVRFKLRLPISQRKLKFFLETGADERPDEVLIQPESKLITAIKEEDYFSGFQLTLGDEHDWQFKPSVGLHLGSDIYPYAKFRIKKRYALEKWSINWHETPFWFDNEIGWGFDSYFEVNRKTSKNSLFRAATFARWTNEPDQFEMSQTFTMFHILSKRDALSYYVGVYGISEPTVFAEHYLLGSTYRQNIHEDYLFLDIIPQIRYQKINDFHAEYTLTFRVEMFFIK